MGRLFGTDGVRGFANKELTPELAYKLGRAGAYILTKDLQEKGKIIIGKDTRISGDMLEAALIAGITSVGVDVVRAGVIPTPGISYLTRFDKAQAGIVISASHNPFHDNGIKFFGSDGYKLPDAMEEEIERLVLDAEEEIVSAEGEKIGRVILDDEALDKYRKMLMSTINGDFSGLKVVLDCAHGAAYQLAPRILQELDAHVITIGDKPNGVNINHNCGSTHLEMLQKMVVETKADLGIAHDGDADRVLFVDRYGQVIDGDFIMVILALDLMKEDKLKDNKLVITVMSNLGLHLALKKAGVQLIETKVGDRYVLEAMKEQGAVLGGEQSGHIILLDHNTTGDGILTALQVLAIIKKTKKDLNQLAQQMKRLPQSLVNVRVSDKKKVMESPILAQAVSLGEERLAGEGRILVRPSGTEPLVRVMAEGPSEEVLENVIKEIVEVVEKL